MFSVQFSSPVLSTWYKAPYSLYHGMVWSMGLQTGQTTHGSPLSIVPLGSASFKSGLGENSQRICRHGLCILFNSSSRWVLNAELSLKDQFSLGNSVHLHNMQVHNMLVQSGTFSHPFLIKIRVLECLAFKKTNKPWGVNLTGGSWETRTDTRVPVPVVTKMKELPPIIHHSTSNCYISFTTARASSWRPWYAGTGKWIAKDLKGV